MKVSMVTGPGKAEVVDADRPQIGPNDALVKMRACGICGSDAFYITIGGVPPRQGRMPLGHEPAGEIVEVGADVSGIAVGDHVVINPMAAAGGIIGNGGATGALADYLLIENAVRGTSVEVIPHDIPVGSGRAQRTDGRRAPRRQSLQTETVGQGRRSSVPGRSGWARRSRSNPLGQAMSWSPI